MSVVYVVLGTEKRSAIVFGKAIRTNVFGNWTKKNSSERDNFENKYLFFSQAKSPNIIIYGRQPYLSPETGNLQT